MKCRSIVAIAVAIVVSSFGAVSFAADVNTTTTYNTNSNKIEVNTSVAGAAVDSEVTYIVKSKGEVVYIDQDTAKDGLVNFSYRIDKNKIIEYDTAVKFGSSSSEEKFSGIGVDSLGIKTLQQADSTENYTIVYQGGKKAWGYGEEVVVSVVPKSGYEVVSISVGGVKQDTLSTTFTIKYDEVITATVEKIDAEPSVDFVVLGVAEETGVNQGLKSRIAILKPQGDISEIGVVYKGDYYPSLFNGMSAVKIIFPADTPDDECTFDCLYYKDASGNITNVPYVSDSVR